MKIERLKATLGELHYANLSLADLCEEQAKEIARLTAENETLKEGAGTLPDAKQTKRVK